ncbi:MAG TPA: flavodoxin domain-containing protein [Spirochaetota bacterium]|nr:flavodoxin domain-containing protein [Spirochaetota bacterium]HPC41166.1 flavodoxin domain-containing protein [Spirochaetota bacterium]HPL18876.1 flavodoxin domain-containing protein [Spirochaetota bacterium]HQF07086.1 flavodoxin domain-containing protein [Spirochaetota bacterium]HQH95823.1 flavodoxin domain-containing protein [Spirochaetota bacterium]
MGTLIVYMSKHGCAEKAARIISESLADGDVTAVDLKSRADIDLSRYDTVIIGGSIYLGSIQKGLRKFCEKNLPELLTKRIGLFICCMNQDEAARKHYEAVFDEALRTHAAAAGIFGGELDFDQLSLLEKSVLSQAVNITESVSRFDKSAVRKFAAKLTRALG